MSKMFKLYVLALCLGFLVGCGGGGSSGNDDGKDEAKPSITFKSLDVFPVFAQQDTANKYISAKLYVQSPEQIGVFKASMDSNNKFTSSQEGLYEAIEPILNTEAKVEIKANNVDGYKPNMSTLWLKGTNEDITQDAVLDDIFGNVGGMVVEASVAYAYDGVTESDFNKYVLSSLSPSGFSCKKTENRYWGCVKQSSDKSVVYEWHSDDNAGAAYFTAYEADYYKY